jgi:hypothetical protein
VAEPESWSYQDHRWIPSSEEKEDYHLHGDVHGWDRPFPEGPHTCPSCGWVGDVNDDPEGRCMAPGKFIVVLDVSKAPEYTQLWSSAGLKDALQRAGFPEVSVHENLDQLKNAVQAGTVDLKSRRSE